MNRYRTLIPVLAVAAPLALASPSFASEYGSDLNAVNNPSSLGCPPDGCTLVQTSFGSLPSDGVITRWRVKLGNGAKARLRMVENDYGSDYRPVADGPDVTGTGGVTSVDTRIPLGGGRYYQGVELDSGTIQTDRYAGAETLSFESPWNGWREADGRGEHELLTQVTVEPDIDGDGYGDDSQDGCVFCSSGGGSGSGSGSSGSGSGSSGSGSGSSSGSGIYGTDRPAAKLVIDPRGFFEFNNGTPYISLYFDNQGNKDLKGSIALKYGKKTLKEINKGVNGRFEIEWDEQKSSSNFKIPKALVRRIQRRGSASLTAVAKMTAETGQTKTFTRTVKVRKAGLTNRYDGTYKGSGGLTIIVSGGFLININQPMNTFCQGSNQFQMRSLYTLGGYPLMVGRDGSFKAKGSRSSDSVRYEGKLKPKGTFKGYSSLFHTQINPGAEGRIAFEQCFAASNWTATRVKKG